MAQFLLDTFTGTNSSAVTARSGETGATWTRNGASGPLAILFSNALDGASLDQYTASGTPAGADYSVSANLQYKDPDNSGNGVMVGVVFGWVDQNNFYFAGWDAYSRSPLQRWRIIKRVAGAWSEVGTPHTYFPAVNDVVAIEGGRSGSTVYLKVNGTQVASGAADSAITGVGKAGFIAFGSAVQTGKGLILLDISADDIASAGDTQAPTVPGTPTVGTVTASSAQFSWTAATDNTAVTGYEIQAADGAGTDVGGVVDVGNVLTTTLSGLAGGTARKLKVRAYDAAANRSAWSALSATATTTQLKLEVTLNTRDGSGNLIPLANVTGWAAWWPNIAAVRTAIASYASAAVSTDATGKLSLNAPAGVSTTGPNQGYLIFSTQDATPDTAEVIWAGPADVV